MGEERQTELDRASTFWDGRHTDSANLKWHWWQHPEVAARLGELVCGEACATTAELAARGIARHCKEALPFERGISLGCGSAHKELALLKAGLVRHFTAYDISAEALVKARHAVEKAGFGAAVSLNQGDALGTERGKFDLVYWDNSLHHMFDVHAAMAWSKARLNPGGCLVVNDYVGPNRFQWPDPLLMLCNTVIAPVGVPLTRRVDRRLMEKLDPSEAADSERTQEALFRFFPNATWIPLGGVVYHMGLTGKAIEMTPPLIERFMDADMRLNAEGHYVYAFAVAWK